MGHESISSFVYVTTPGMKNVDSTKRLLGRSRKGDASDEGPASFEALVVFISSTPPSVNISAPNCSPFSASANNVAEMTPGS